MTTNGPTLNADYNATIAKWERDGYPSRVECEECGCSMIGRHVVCTGVTWVCEACAEAEDDPEPCYREDFESDRYRAIGCPFQPQP